MRKSYKVTVNGTPYVVEIEELGAATVPTYSPVPAAPAPAPAPVAAAPVAAPAPAPAVPAGGESGVTSPMPGTILAINVKAGDKVKAGDVLLILEAMKMENEIVAPQDGVVSRVAVTKGASVNTGDLLIAL